jgi:hypothetical protein
MWLSKPAAMSYDDFYALLSRWTAQTGVGLWGRQMTLGPTPEFCLRSTAPLDLPDSLNVLTVSLQQVWP